MSISLMEAYITETLKEKGITAKEVEQRLTNNDFTDWQDQFTFDFSLLKELSPEELQKAFAGEYQVKFVTINGLKNLLRMRFGIEEHQYKEVENGLLHLSVSAEIESQIRAMMSSNWTVKRVDEEISIMVEG